ncbi:MAG: AI-2E family transporter [Armatimonadetes bacterium]|nr:AI-2E family transporter [Armatimonadota bacterium]
MKNDSYPRVFIVCAALFAVAAALYILQWTYEPVISPFLSVIPPFAIALVLAFMLDPLVDWLQRHRLSRGVAVLVVGLSFLVVFVMVALALVPKISDQAQLLAGNFPGYVEQGQKLLYDFLETHKALLTRFHLPTSTGELAARYSDQIQGAVKKSLEYFSSVLGSAASKLLWIIIIPMSTFLLLKDLDYIKAKVIHLTPEKHRTRIVAVTSAVGGVFGKYVRGMMIVAILYSIVASIVLSAFGLQYALIIGVVAGLFYLVPYLGNIVIVGMSVIALLVQPGHTGAQAGILAGILLVQSMIVFDLFITPRIAGGSVGVHPVLALFSLALGAQMFGVIGMVFAVPVMASLQVAMGQAFPVIYERVRQHAPRQAKEPEEKSKKED